MSLVPNPISVARELGIEVALCPLTRLNGLLVSDGGTWYIGVNNRLSVPRRRFTVAHELGHYLMHRGRQPCFLCRPGETSPQEREADRFAAEMLMPASLVADFVLGMQSEEEACEHFGVSRAAWLARVKALCESTELGNELRERLYAKERERVQEPDRLVRAMSDDGEYSGPKVIRRKRGRVIYIYGSDSL